MRKSIVAVAAVLILAMAATHAPAQPAPAQPAPAQPAPVRPSQAAPAPTPEAVQHYIADHPNVFAQRKIFALDQLLFTRDVPQAILQQIEPATTMEQVVTILTANHIEYRRANGRLDAVGNDPRFIDSVLKLTSDDLFSVPMGQYLLINKVTAVETVPFTGDQATKYAEALLSGKTPQAANPLAQ